MTVVHSGLEVENLNRRDHDHQPGSVPALEVKHLCAGYGQKRAIDDVTVRIVFRSIIGLLPLMSGEVFINGRSDRQARQQAAYVPQLEDVDWTFPVAVIDVVEMGLARQVGWLRLPNRRHHQAAREALDRVGMVEYEKTQIGELSGGQKRRVFIARALAQGATILLLDEPFSGVDAVAQQNLFEILDRLRDDGVTVLLATHDLNLAATHFDELLILNQHVIAYGKSEEVFRPEILAKAFGGQLAIWENGHQLVMLTDQHT